jgi:hypothetical protein
MSFSELLQSKLGEHITDDVIKLLFFYYLKLLFLKLD